MSPAERIEVSIRLRMPDRIPVAPDFDLYLARHAGLTMRELLFDMRKAEDALERAYLDFRWDANHLFLGGVGPYMQVVFSQAFRMPGVDGVADDEVPQMIEKELAGPDIYEEICRKGFAAVHLKNLERIIPELRTPWGRIRYFTGLLVLAARVRRHIGRWRKKGIPCLAGAMPGILALDALSGARSVGEFCKDLHRRPDMVLRAMSVTNRFCIEVLIRSTKLSGARYCFIGSARPSSSFISPRLFERFALPLFVEATRRLVDEGITPFLHFDSDWTPMLPYLRELPRAKCILNLDGTTDIFRAKEVLGDHMCIMGDVPASLLKLGTTEEVDEYCRRLIEEVGDGGGFILSSGCSVPPDAKPENVRAMVESVRRYRP